MHSASSRIASPAEVGSRGRVLFFYLAYFVSGMPALIYQVIWQRTLTLYFGVDIYSVSITVATFMFGLGVGSLLGGRLADRTHRPGAIYAVVELLIALFGMASIWLFSTVGSVFAGSPIGVVLVVDFLLLLVPTTLMGMTMPLMSRVVASDDAAIGRHLSRLYAFNTLGAAVGALLSAYLLIGLLGLSGATYVGAAINILLALVMFPVGARVHTTADEEPSVGTRAATPKALLSYNEVWLLSFASGFIALGYQIAWYRILGIILHGTVYVFGTILFFFLLGIAAGSFRAKRNIDEGGNAERFALSQLVIAAYVLVSFVAIGLCSSMPGLRHLLSASNFTTFHPSPELAAGNRDIFALYSFGGLVIWVCFFILVPTYWMGVGFPNLLREGSRTVAHLGRSVGGLYFANIVGSTAGSLFVGFIEIHYFGTARAAMLMCILGCVIAIYVYARTRDVGRGPLFRFALPLATLVLIVAAFPTPGRLLRAVHFADFHDKVDYVGFEDRTGVAVLRRQHQIVGFSQEERILDEWRLYIDGGTHGGYGKGEKNLLPDLHMQMALASHDAPKRVLSIGLGDGRICQSAALDPRVEQLTIIELNGVLRRTLEQINQGKELFASTKIHYEVDDGRRWMLAHPEQKFDFIMMWPLHAAHAFSGSLYSREFMQLLKSRLSPGGRVMMRSADAFSTARTIAEEFPHVVRIGGGSYVCSMSPIQFDVTHLPTGATADDLLDQIQADRETILARTNGARLNTDFVLNSEYYLTYPFVAALQTRVPYRIYHEASRDPFVRYVRGG